MSFPSEPSGSEGDRDHAFHDHSSQFLDTLFGSSGPTHDTLPVAQVQGIATKVAKTLAPTLNKTIKIMLVQRSDIGPLASVVGPTGNCLVVVNENPRAWALWGRFLNKLPPEQWSAVIELAAAHEVGHCAEKYQEAEGIHTAAKVGTLNSEIYADVFGMMYAKRHMGEQADMATDTILKVRLDYAGSDAAHASGATLLMVQKQLDNADIQAPLQAITLALVNAHVAQ